MAYRVVYQAAKKVRGAEKRRSGAAALVGLALVLGVLTPWGRELLIPGNPAVTVGALRELSEDLKAGQSLEEALEAFCREVAQVDPA